MKNVTVGLGEYHRQGSPTEKVIIEYILENPKKTSEMTIYQLARKTFSSPASIIRMCKNNGFEGYRDFTKTLIYELAIRQRRKEKERKQIQKSDTLEEIIEDTAYRNIMSLEDTRSIMDKEILKKSIELLSRCRNICIFGIGSSFIVAKDAQQKFMRLNRYCFVNEDWHLQLLTARNMSSKDLGIIISYSGQTKEMIECAEAMKKNNVKIISITKYGSSPIVELCDYNIFVAANESTFRSGAMSSRISQLNIIDTLYTGYANLHYEDSLELISKTHIKKGENND